MTSGRDDLARAVQEARARLKVTREEAERSRSDVERRYDRLSETEVVDRLEGLVQAFLEVMAAHGNPATSQWTWLTRGWRPRERTSRGWQFGAHEEATSAGERSVSGTVSLWVFVDGTGLADHRKGAAVLAEAARDYVKAARRAHGSPERVVIDAAELLVREGLPVQEAE